MTRVPLVEVAPDHVLENPAVRDTKQALGSHVRAVIEIPRLDRHFTGTGDLIAALLLAWMQRLPADYITAVENALASVQVRLPVPPSLALCLLPDNVGLSFFLGHRGGVPWCLSRHTCARVCVATSSQAVVKTTAKHGGELRVVACKTDIETPPDSCRLRARLVHC